MRGMMLGRDEVTATPPPLPPPLLLPAAAAPAAPIGMPIGIGAPTRPAGAPTALTPLDVDGVAAMIALLAPLVVGDTPQVGGTDNARTE